MATKTNDLDVILVGKTGDDQNAILQAKASVPDDLLVVLKAQESNNNLLDVILEGKKPDDLQVILSTRTDEDLSVILNAIDPPDLSSTFNFMQSEISNFKITSGNLINEIEIRYGFDHADGKYKYAITKHNPLSKVIYRESKAILELIMVQSTRVAEKVADGVLRTSSIPEVICSYDHDLRSVFIEVGDIASITHQAGLGAGGYVDKLGTITKKIINDPVINYILTILSDPKLYKSILKELSKVASAEEAGITITYAEGVATITVYADVEGNPPVEGAEVTINQVRKITDSKGQVRFNLEQGTYTAYITASGYEDAQITFTV
jgi:hypothetical protein